MPTTTSVSSSASSSSPPTLPSPATLLFFLWQAGQRVDSLCLHLSHISCAVLELGTCCDRSAFIYLAWLHSTHSLPYFMYNFLYFITALAVVVVVWESYLLFECEYCCINISGISSTHFTLHPIRRRNAEHELAMNLAKGNKLKKRPKITEKSIENKLL